MNEEKKIVRQKVNAERRSLVEQIENWLEVPMLVLGFLKLATFLQSFDKSVAGRSRNAERHCW